LECIREIRPLLAKVPNQVEKMFYLSLLADRTQSSETALLDELKKLSSTRTQFPSFPKKFVLSQNSLSKDLCKPDRVYYAERELVQLMLQEERFIESLRNSLPVESFRNAALREIARSLYEHYRDGLEGVSQKVIEALPSEEQRSLALQLSLERKEYEEVDKLVVDCLRVIENKKKTKPQIEELAMMYQQARTEEQYDDFGELQRQYLKMTRQEKR
jgi:DNA primase